MIRSIFANVKFYKVKKRTRKQKDRQTYYFDIVKRLYNNSKCIEIGAFVKKLYVGIHIIYIHITYF